MTIFENSAASTSNSYFCSCRDNIFSGYGITRKNKPVCSLQWTAQNKSPEEDIVSELLKNGCVKCFVFFTKFSFLLSKLLLRFTDKVWSYRLPTPFSPSSSSIFESSRAKQSNLQTENPFEKQSGSSDAFSLESAKLREPIHVTDESLWGLGGPKCLLFCVLIWCWWRRQDGFIFARSASRKMPSFDKFRIIYHPERAEIIFVANETFVKWQIGTYRVLRRLPNLSKELKGRRKITVTKVEVYR